MLQIQILITRVYGGVAKGNILQGTIFTSKMQFTSLKTIYMPITFSFNLNIVLCYKTNRTRQIHFFNYVLLPLRRFAGSLYKQNFL